MLRSVLLGFALAVPIASQQIYDIVSGPVIVDSALHP